MSAAVVALLSMIGGNAIPLYIAVAQATPAEPTAELELPVTLDAPANADPSDDPEAEPKEVEAHPDAPSRAGLPWARRRRTAVRVSSASDAAHAVSARQLRRVGLRPRPGGQVDPSRWPAEPATPKRIHSARFVEAFRELCPPWTERGHTEWVARLVLQEATAFEIDPMLLGALVHHQSMCDPLADNSYGTGLTMISLSMHRRYFGSDGYRYWVPAKGSYKRKELPLVGWPFSHDDVLRPEANLYFAAGLLKIFSQQCPHIDGPSGSMSHRHFVSHFVWGDAVRDTSAEEGILESRRRLLQYYTGRKEPLRTEYQGVRIASPLDGVPRVITGVWGDDRDHGHRRHAGIDFASVAGEPVRAVAAGVVELAGADLRPERFLNLDPVRAGTIPPERMGPRGLFIRIDHGRGVGSLYAHLASYVVRRGDRVEPGDLLGYVGRTGMHSSDAHLHFGLFYRGEPVDPLPVFSAYGFWPGRDRPHGDPPNNGRSVEKPARVRKGSRSRRGAAAEDRQGEGETAGTAPATARTVSSQADLRRLLAR